MSLSRRSGAGCLAVCAVPFLVAGIYGGVISYALATRAAEPRLALVFGCVALAFGCAGLAMIAAASARRGNREPEEDLRALHPEEPWLWKAEWASRRIRDQSRSGTARLWAFALIWNAIASSLLLFLPGAVEKGMRLAWIGLLFPAAGAVLLIAAMSSTLRRLRFRDSTLSLDSMPVPPGGTLRGTVSVPNELAGVSALTIRLNEITRSETRSSSSETIACRAERDIDPSSIRPASDGAAIPIDIAVPPDALPTETHRTWQLDVDAELPGVDYSATFEVPVFATAASAPRPHGVSPVAGPPRAPRSFFEREGPDGHELVFPAFRSPALAFRALLCATFTIGTALFTIEIGAPRVMTVLVALVAIPFVLSMLDLFFASRKVIVGPEHLHVRRRLILSSETRIPYGEIVGARAVPALQSGARSYFHVDVLTKSGKRIRVAQSIRGKREADWVVSRIGR